MSGSKGPVSWMWGLMGGVRLVKAAVTCLLPERLYGGWEGGVLWYDLDGHFDILRLVCLLQARIHQGKALSCGMILIFFVHFMLGDDICPRLLGFRVFGGKSMFLILQEMAWQGCSSENRGRQKF